MRFGGTYLFGFGGFGAGPGGIGGTGSVPIANNHPALLGFGGFGAGPGGIGGTGSVPIANHPRTLFGFVGFGAGPGGIGGTGSVPIANKPGLSAATTVPETARRSETAVKTTSNASRTVTARFFIEALQDERMVPAKQTPALRRA